ncbi:MAG TPA: type II toxin-antitoxin system VapC family toxin [Thermoanaerobaculia bacterium]|nr:type II toxin-antitoxin system VapC family toxin [Thermoanaerobaculia bacterium]
MTPRFMLDTDTVSFALRGQGHVADHLAANKPSQVCLSAITLAELRFGANYRRSRKLHALIDAFTAGVQVVPFDAAAAVGFGTLGASLAHAGSPIGEFDTMIAAHALALNITLISNNTKHFARIPGLRLENWYSS